MNTILNLQDEPEETPDETKASMGSWAMCWQSNKSVWCATWPW